MQVPALSFPLLTIPAIGLGTWELRGSECTDVIKAAWELGYRHIDTAHIYDNHEAIRKALQGFDRSSLFLVSKFVTSQLTNGKGVEKACDKALKELGTDYLDLYLLHAPDRNAPMREILTELLALVKKSKCKAVGVSNFTVRHLKDMVSWNIHVSVNQVEFHPYLYQRELLQFCQNNQICLEAYRPLGKGALIRDPIFENIGKKHGKTASQVCLNWLYQKKIPFIVKASSKKHLLEDLQVFDFSLSKEEIATLDQLKIQERFCESDWSDFAYV